MSSKAELKQCCKIPGCAAVTRMIRTHAKISTDGAFCKASASVQPPTKGRLVLLRQPSSGAAGHGDLDQFVDRSIDRARTAQRATVRRI
jgi:hypothetical protein